ncbi:hypothetical protein [Ferrovum sp.]|uniref:hypothetical protein n=1 Tax=Ferrovum sp. TaxID=2609467 RepID=UPI00262FFF60|nr:hypothetical protein [Ferrovum sp.]
MAQKDMRALTVAVSGNAGEAAVDCRNRLIIEAGTVVKMDDDAGPQPKQVETLDRIGLAELKRMM